MKVWLSTPVNYGCLIRISLLFIFSLLLLMSAIDIIFNIGGTHWTFVSATVLSVVGIVIGLGQWLIPFPQTENSTNPASSDELKYWIEQEETNLKANATDGTGTLIVSASKERRGDNVYLLPRSEFLNAKSGVEREGNKHKRIGTITRMRSGSNIVYITLFRGLRADRYNIWTKYGEEHPKDKRVQIYKGEVSEFQIDWTK